MSHDEAPSMRQECRRLGGERDAGRACGNGPHRDGCNRKCRNGPKTFEQPKKRIAEDDFALLGRALRMRALSDLVRRFSD